MNINDFTLLIAILLFGGFNLYLNMKTGGKVMKRLTYIFVYISLAMSLVLILISWIGG